MSNVEKIRTKIAALLKKTKSNGASEAEAAAAMSIASKLMAEHGITMNDIKENTAAARDFIKRHANAGSKNLSVIDKFVVVAIGSYTDTKVWNSKEFDGFKMGKKNMKPKYISRLMFYGYSVDVELADYIYKVCDSAVEAEWKKYSVTIPRGERAKSRITFQLGMALRLRDRLMSMKKTNMQETNGTDLVVLKRQLVETSFKTDVATNLSKGSAAGVKFKQGRVFEDGKKAADAVHFNREVHDGPQGGVKLIA